MLTLTEVIDEGAPLGSLAYLETLLAALEDGELSTDESEQLAGLALAYEMSDTDVASTQRAFILALAHRALDDGHVSRHEREELHRLASTIGVASEVVLDVIARADAARSARMSEGLRPLPADWGHGDPLRVGDKVVFTGCDDMQRSHLEQKAESLGVRVTGGVSGQTTMLVTDGGFQGTKAARAAELSVRVVHPDVFDILLTYLQPARTSIQSVATTRATVGKSRTGTAPTNDASTQNGSRGAAPSVVRAWAISQGIDVGVRGRLQSEVFEAFWLAQPGETRELDTGESPAGYR